MGNCAATRGRPSAPSLPARNAERVEWSALDIDNCYGAGHAAVMARKVRVEYPGATYLNHE